VIKPSFERWACLNGKLCLLDEAFIPIADRGFLFGDGIFTTIRLEEGRCQLFKGHMRRLHEHAHALGFDYRLPPGEWLERLIEKNQACTGTWRLKIIVTVERSHERASQGTFIALMEQFEAIPFHSSRLCVYPKSVESPSADLKTLSYLDRFLIKEHARKLGFDDAISTNAEGVVLETGSSNIFWTDCGSFCFPDPGLPFLKGVFAQALISVLPIPINYARARIQEISPEAHIYTCNAISRVRPVRAIGTQTFGRNGELEDLLHKATLAALDRDG
jgi:4-amino-4-deoxychorismate lyase